MIVIDSSFWIELFAGTELGRVINDNADFQNGNFILPSIVVTEVYKKLLTEVDEYTALLFTTQMKVGKIVDLNFDLAINSAYNGKKYKLPLADSIIYTTAITHNAQIYTLDKHFQNLPNVHYFEKK